MNKMLFEHQTNIDVGIRVAEPPSVCYSDSEMQTLLGRSYYENCCSFYSTLRLFMHALAVQRSQI